MTPDKNTFKWGLIGPGRIAAQFAQATQAEFVGTLQAVASRDLNRAQAFAKEHNIAKTYDDYQALLNDDDIDAIYIATPHRFHYEQIKQCLMAKKSVLCEKPLTINQAQAKTLFELAKTQNVFLMEAMWTLFLPVYQAVQQWIAQGDIGELKYVQSTFGFPMPADSNERWLNKSLAGGVLLDMGVYNVTTADWFINKALDKTDETLSKPQIQAMGTVGQSGVDEFTLVNMQYQNQYQTNADNKNTDKKYAQFACNFHAQTENCLWIYGSTGRIKIENMFWGSDSASLYQQDNETATKVFHEPLAINGFEYEIAEAERCIKQGLLQSPVASAQQTQQQLGIMDEIRAQLGVHYPFADE